MLHIDRRVSECVYFIDMLSVAISQYHTLC